MKIVEIDPNVRVKGNLTFVNADDLKPNEEVFAWEPELRWYWLAIVQEIDSEKNLAYLYVKWKEHWSLPANFDVQTFAAILHWINNMYDPEFGSHTTLMSLLGYFISNNYVIRTEKS